MVTRRLEGCKAGSGKFVRSGREGNKAGRVRTGVENAPEWGCRNRVTVVTSLQSVSSPSLTADFGLSSLRSISSSGLAADFGLSSLRSISSSGLATDFGFPPCALSVPFLWNDHGLRSVSSDDLRSSSVPVSRVLQRIGRLPDPARHGAVFCFLFSRLEKRKCKVRNEVPETGSNDDTVSVSFRPSRVPALPHHNRTEERPFGRSSVFLRTDTQQPDHSVTGVSTSAI